MSPLSELRVTVLSQDQTQDNKPWHLHPVAVDQITNDNPDLRFVFIEQSMIEPRESSVLGKYLKTQFQIPEFFWDRIRKENTGCFGSSQISDGITSWFRFLFKHLNEPNSDVAYEWFYLSFYTYWEKDKCNTILCFNLSTAMKEDVQKSLERYGNSHDSDPYSPHALIMEQLPKWFDKQVWRMRDLVRAIEQKRKRLATHTEHDNDLKDIDHIHDNIHELSRHLVHALESIGVAIEVMTSTAADHEIFTHDYKFSFSIDQQSAQSSVQSTEERLLAFRTSRNVQRLFQEQLLITKCLKERIQSLEDRLDHEITLRENILDREIKNDSAAMKGIGLVTLLFLPATSISTIFSTSFFNYHPKAGESKVSSDFWIYWAVTVPITICALGIGWSWYRSSKKLSIIPSWVHNSFKAIGELFAHSGSKSKKAKNIAGDPCESTSPPDSNDKVIQGIEGSGTSPPSIGNDPSGRIDASTTRPVNKPESDDKRNIQPITAHAERSTDSNGSQARAQGEDGAVTETRSGLLSIHKLRGGQQKLEDSNV